LNEKRLKSTSLSEFFQQLLNMIIQSEKKYKEAKKTLSPLSLLTLHVIDTSGVQQQHITALRRDLELKKRNMKMQMEAEQTVKNAEKVYSKSFCVN